MKETKMVERIEHGERLLAIIIPSEFKRAEIEFFTPDDFSQQLAYMNRPAGYRIPPHVHNKIARNVHYTQETLFVRRGRVRIDFYSDERDFVGSRVLKTGDIILLASGGHGFTMLEETEIIEVKQGPYSGDADKVRFEGKAVE